MYHYSWQSIDGWVGSEIPLTTDLSDLWDRSQIPKISKCAACKHHLRNQYAEFRDLHVKLQIAGLTGGVNALVGGWADWISVTTENIL